MATTDIEDDNNFYQPNKESKQQQQQQLAWPNFFHTEKSLTHWRPFTFLAFTGGESSALEIETLKNNGNMLHIPHQKEE